MCGHARRHARRRFNPKTQVITSVDIDLESLDAFAKSLPLGDQPANHLVFVVEAATGTLLALSHPELDTHQHDDDDDDDYALPLAADCEVDAVARAAAACVRACVRALSEFVACLAGV